MMKAIEKSTSNVQAVPSILLGGGELPRRRMPRREPRRDPVAAVMAVQELRAQMHEASAFRQDFRRQHAPWRRIAAKLFGLALLGGLGFVVIAHAMAG